MRINDSLRRHIDAIIKRRVRKALRDYGVAGMKKGQHVKARDPEYVESLKGGGGGNSGGWSTGKKVAAVGAGLAAFAGRKKIGALARAFGSKALSLGNKVKKNAQSSMNALPSSSKMKALPNPDKSLSANEKRMSYAQKQMKNRRYVQHLHGPLIDF